MNAPRRIPKALLAAAALAALGLAGCGGSTPAASTCAEVPDYDKPCAQRGGYSWEPEWREAQAPLPPLPAEDDLERIEAPAVGSRYDVFVDSRNITRGNDGVMRYTVVVVSRTGARNVFHEGLRCLTDQVRTYAYASREGPFRPSVDDTWRPMATRGVRGYQNYLANVIMCDRHGYAWDADKARDALAGQYTAGGVRIERFCRDLDNCGPYNRSD